MINRAGNKEKAKRVLNENGNLSGMVGMEILYRVIAAITSVLLGAMIAGGIGVVSAVVSAPFKLFGLAGIIIAYVLITPIATLVGAIAGGAVAGPFEVARYRYYLSLRKNGIRPKVTCIFDAFDVAPYKMMATAFVYEEMKGRPVMVDDIKPSTDGNGMTIAVDPKKLMGIGSTGGKKPTSHIPAASRAAGAALEGVAGMYAGSSYPLEPNQPVILGRDPAYAKIVFSQGAQKISRRHCEVMFNSQVQKYRVTDFSSNGTYVNGSRLPANSPVLLTRGTELALGDNNNIIRLS